jgi:hypothetical protein
VQSNILLLPTTFLDARGKLHSNPGHAIGLPLDDQLAESIHPTNVELLRANPIVRRHSRGLTSQRRRLFIVKSDQPITHPQTLPSLIECASVPVRGEIRYNFRGETPTISWDTVLRIGLLSTCEFHYQALWRHVCLLTRA